jgi:hypothetical protein
MGNFRPRISHEEFDVVKQYRAIKRESNELGLNDEDVKHGWLKSKNASLFFKNPNFKEAEEVKRLLSITKGMRKSNQSVSQSFLKEEVDMIGNSTEPVQSTAPPVDMPTPNVSNKTEEMKKKYFDDLLKTFRTQN